MKDIIQLTFSTLRFALSTVVLFALIAVLTLAYNRVDFSDIWFYIIGTNILLLIFPEVCQCRICRADPNRIILRFGQFKIH